MAKSLNDQDRRAIDLLLDSAARSSTGRGNGNGNGGSNGGTPQHHSVGSGSRVSAAERVLSLLDALPVEEPSADLVERTLRRIARQSGSRNIQPGLNAGPFAPGSQPHA